LPIYYTVLVAAAFWILKQSELSEARFKAKSAMAVNHRVGREDLLPVEAEGKLDESELKAISGHYARTQVREGQIVRATDFAPSPLLRPVGKTVLLGLPVARAPKANAGTPFYICAAGKEIGRFDASAVVCEGGEDQECTAIANLQADNAGKILGALPPKGKASLTTAECAAAGVAGAQPQR
jgi:hypothetical protein